MGQDIGDARRDLACRKAMLHAGNYLGLNKAGELAQAVWQGYRMWDRKRHYLSSLMDSPQMIAMHYGILMTLVQRTYLL